MDQEQVPLNLPIPLLVRQRRVYGHELLALNNVPLNQDFNALPPPPNQYLAPPANFDWDLMFGTIAERKFAHEILTGHDAPLIDGRCVAHGCNEQVHPPDMTD